MSNQLNVLIIEDQKHDYNMAKYALSKSEFPCEVSWAKRGEEALSTLENREYDVAVLDYKLPGMNGLEIYQAMKANEITMPTIFVTGSSTITIAVDALKLGAKDFLVKDTSGKYLNLLPVVIQKVYEESQIEIAKFKAEEALRESDERLRSTIASLDDLVFVLDKDGSFMSYFQAPSKPEIVETPEFFLGQSYEDVLPSHVAKLVTQALEAALATNSVQQFDYSLTSATHTYWFNAKLSLRYDKFGLFSGATIVVRDVTERQLTTLMLKQRTEQLEALRQIGLELTSELEIDVLLKLIVDTAVSLLNGTIGSLYLFSEDKQHLKFAIASGRHDVYWESELQKGSGIGGNVWELNKPIIFNHSAEWEGRFDNDNQNPTAFIGMPIQWQDELLGVLTIAAEHPIHFSVNDSKLLNLYAMQAAVALHNAKLLQQIQNHRNKLEERVADRTEELSIANKRLQTLHDLKSKFIDDITHELRTPITNLKLHIDLLNRGKPEKKEIYMDVIASQTNRLESIFEQIVELTRLTEINDEQFELIDINNMIGQIFLSYCWPTNNETNLVTKFEPDESIPKIKASKKHIVSIARQLIINASNYTEEGRIIVKTYPENDLICLEVEDTGIGIDKSDLPYIFDRFYRGQDVCQLTKPGAGVGLAMVKEIVDFYGGEIIVESKKGKGSTFIVKLPAT